jgi:hypothetical protein
MPSYASIENFLEVEGKELKEKSGGPGNGKNRADPFDCAQDRLFERREGWGRPPWLFERTKSPRQSGADAVI